MTEHPSDALVLFGATGDLAQKKIFPALQAMVKRGHLGVPVIGVAKSGLIGDAMVGDATLFAREDAVEAAWAIVDPILKLPTPVYPYEPNTWGPPEADRVTAKIGGWHKPAPAKEVAR